MTSELSPPMSSDEDRLTDPTTPRPRAAGLRRRLWSIGGAVLTVLAVAGCSVGPPTVGFYGNRQYVAGEPAFWCEIESDLVISCPAEPTDVTAKIALKPGQGVVISAPLELRDTAWTVVITYFDAQGRQQAARSPIFEAGSTLTHEVRMGQGEQLVEVDVMSITATIDEATGVVEYPPWRLWVLEIEPIVPGVPAGDR